ncbi:MAG: hypothetical protein Pg6A_11390 [Termitinemataceae bacterium]|nr:MAG: hypothetical protein Pg6A_11390 [Termitinemataceae bacterium]
MAINLVTLSPPPPPPCNTVKRIRARFASAAVVTAFAVLAAAGFAGCKATGGPGDNDEPDNRTWPVTLTYKSTYTGPDDVTQDGMSGEPLTLKPANTFTPQPSYYFSSWNTESSGGGESYLPEQTLTVNSNITLYAKWTQTPPAAFKVNYQTSHNPSADKPEETGWINGTPRALKSYSSILNANSAWGNAGSVFTGWSIKADDTQAMFYDGQIVTHLAAENDTTEVNLYAVWRTATSAVYTVTYSANGGTGSVVDQSDVEGTIITLDDGSGINMAGFSFAGWNTQADGLGQSYPGGASCTLSGNLTLYAKWREIGLVAGEENNPDLMIKFGVKSAGYSTNDISAQDVTNTLNRVSAYLHTQSASSVNPSTGLGVIKLGDYVNLKSLNIAVYNNNPEVNLTNTAAGDDKLRVIVVGINSYYNKNGNGTSTPHLIFHFKDFPGTARMNATNTNYGGYLGSEIRTYLTGSYWDALKTSGVPDAVVWPVSRRVANDGILATGADTIEDKLWLPTERELFGSNSYSSSTYETSANQGSLGYYNDNAARKKSNWYWEASPGYSAASSFCRVGSTGSSISLIAAEVGGCAPAFCVK